MNDATLERLDHAVMRAVAGVLAAVILARLIALPVMAEVSEGIVICGPQGMTVLSLETDDPEPVEASCAEHCVVVADFMPPEPGEAALSAQALASEPGQTQAPLPALTPRAFHQRAPPLQA